MKKLIKLFILAAAAAYVSQPVLAKSSGDETASVRDYYVQLQNEIKRTLYYDKEHHQGKKCSLKVKVNTSGTLVLPEQERMPNDDPELCQIAEAAILRTRLPQTPSSLLNKTLILDFNPKFD